MLHHYSDDPNFGKRADDGVQEAAEHVSELLDWGFSPALNKYVWDLVESGYQVLPRSQGTAWAPEIKPTDDRKFDLTRAQRALHDLRLKLDLELWHLGQRESTKDLFNLATQLCSVASRSLEKHGDFRDAVKEMGDYVLRDWSHPNAAKRWDLYRVLELYSHAREAFKFRASEFDSGAYGLLYSDYAGWIDSAVEEFRDAAAVYLKTSNAHTQWLTSEISASLLEPYVFLLWRGARRLYPLSRLGAGWREPWCNIVPLCISALLLLLSLALVVGCYVFVSPTAAYVAAGLGGLLYARRFVQAREFRKQRGRVARLWGKVSDLCKDVKTGECNVGEVIRRFREADADDLRLPSIFVSVIGLLEVKPVK